MLYIITSIVFVIDIVSLPHWQHTASSEPDQRRERPVQSLPVHHISPGFVVEKTDRSGNTDCRDHPQTTSERPRTRRSGHSPAIRENDTHPRLPRPQGDAKIRSIGPKFLQDPADRLDLKSPAKAVERINSHPSDAPSRGPVQSKGEAQPVPDRNHGR